MPTSKNAQLRYQTLDRCFSDFSRKYEIKNLLEEVNERLYDLYGDDSTIKERQLREDIKFMRERVGYDAPIQAYRYEGKRCYYRYTDKDFSIFKNELTPKEISDLHSTIEILGRYRGIPDYAWLEEIVSSLEYRFGVKARQESVISFEQNEGLRGLEFLSDVIDAAVNHQPLVVHYATFSGKEFVSILHPYYIKQFNNRWFLFGLEEYNTGNRIANKALDRISKVAHAYIPFVRNTYINFSTYFNNIIGVTHPGDDIKEEQVILRFDKERFPYVVSKPIHHTQKVIDEEACTVRMVVRPNKELEARIFSYGPQV
ncbi:MAG: WYL domain-containing protein [Bacteroides sp.]|nr:WYL domain-containing protein [Bacteroides sp.]